MINEAVYSRLLICDLWDMHKCTKHKHKLGVAKSIVAVCSVAGERGRKFVLTKSFYFLYHCLVRRQQPPHSAMEERTRPSAGSNLIVSDIEYDCTVYMEHSKFQPRTKIKDTFLCQALCSLTLNGKKSSPHKVKIVSQYLRSQVSTMY